MSAATKAPRTLGAAFGGVQTTLAEQREIWLEALHEDAIWEGPMFEKPLSIVGRTACGYFMELLLSVVPKFSTQLVAAYPTADPNTVIIESTGGGDTIYGGKYEQRYFSLITSKDGKAFRMREFCNPFQTYKAFGKERWETRISEIMTKYNAPWPKSQAPDKAALPM
jgi:ketosteroid isomerase-like protein